MSEEEIQQLFSRNYLVAHRACARENLESCLTVAFQLTKLIVEENRDLAHEEKIQAYRERREAREKEKNVPSYG